MTIKVGSNVGLTSNYLKSLGPTGVKLTTAEGRVTNLTSHDGVVVAEVVWKTNGLLPKVLLKNLKELIS